MAAINEPKIPFWKRNRTISYVGLVLVYWIIAWFVQQVDYSNRMPKTWVGLVNDYPQLEILNEPIEWLLEMLSPPMWPYILPAIVGYYFARWVAIDLTRAIYFPEDPALAEKLFIQRTKELDLATVGLSRTQFETQQHEELLLQVGGPGFVEVGEYDVCVTEKNGEVGRVFSSNDKHDLHRFERVQSVLDLRVQERTNPDVELVTAEGFPIRTAVYVTFQIDPVDHRPDHVHEYSFKEPSVRKVANISINDQDVSLDWTHRPLMVVMELLRTHVSNMRMDELLDPNSVRDVIAHPSLQRKVREDARAILKKEGIYLTHARITSLRIEPEMHETLLSYWAAFGEKTASLDVPSQQAVNTSDLARKKVRESIIQKLATSMKNWSSERYQFDDIPPEFLYKGLENINTQALPPLPEMQEFIGDEKPVDEYVMLPTINDGEDEGE